MSVDVVTVPESFLCEACARITAVVGGGVVFFFSDFDCKSIRLNVGTTLNFGGESVVRSLRAPLLIFVKGMGDNSLYYPELDNRLRTK